ncbi:MAG TPA: bleomycin resistance protein [Sphingomonas sp.]|jgi:hypothetical protein|nr:bleomycin resistance protein [Sphingomonas sp.]
MTDHTTPNLPSRDFAATSRFYAALGFIEGWRDNGWMNLPRGDRTLEFFPDPDLDPLTTSSGCCLRLNALDLFFEVCKGADIPETCLGQPRLYAPKTEHGGSRVGALIDLDGNLLRLIQN